MRFLGKHGADLYPSLQREAMNLAVANEDHNIYIFDMRKFDRALNILKDHVAAVMDVGTYSILTMQLREEDFFRLTFTFAEFSPTGEELVSASYDRTIRLWNRDKGHSRDIYHTKRMQRVVSGIFTPRPFDQGVLLLTPFRNSSVQDGPPTPSTSYPAHRTETSG